MRRRLLSALLALCVASTLLVPVSAETGEAPAQLTLGRFAELPAAETSARPGISLFSVSNGEVDKSSGEHEKWIDRLDLSGDSYVNNFYKALEEASDNDETNDYFIKDEYFAQSSNPLVVPEATDENPNPGNPLDDLAAGEFVQASLTASDGKRTNFNGLYFTRVETTVGYSIVENDEGEKGIQLDSDPFQSTEYKYAEKLMTAAYNAFDRDHPEVFWLTGTSYVYTNASISLPGNAPDTGNATAVIDIFFVTKNFTDSEDIRESGYNESTIKNTITALNTKVNAIKGEVSKSSRYETVKALNEKLTKTNEYNSAATKWSDAEKANNQRLPWKCLSGLQVPVSGAGTAVMPVCEGYARAFKVVCDRLSIPCVLVDGHARNKKDAAGEAHMWNYVQLDDSKWYAVDVTWNDPVAEDASGVVSGHESEKWLALGKNDTVADGWTFIESHPVSNRVTADGVEFTNGPDIEATKYVAPNAKITPYVATKPTASAVTYGDELSASTLSGTVQVSEQDSTVVDGTWSWVSDQDVGDAGTRNFTARFTPKDTNTYNTVDVEVPVTVNKAKINISGVSWSSPTTFSYDGEAHSVTLTGVPDTVNAAYTDNNKTYVGDYTAGVTLAPKDSRNYELQGTTSANQPWSITPVNQPVSIQNDSLRKGGNTLNLSDKVSGNKGNLTFTLTNDGGTGSTLSGTILTSGTTEGTVTITVTAAAKDENNDGTAEYKTFSGTLTVEIVDKKTAPLTVTQSGTTYGSELAAPVYDEHVGAGRATVTYAGTTKAGVVYPSSTTKPTEAGSYTVTVSCETSDTIYTGSASFTIDPKSISGAVIVLDSTELVYNKTEQTKPVTSVTVDGKALAGSDYTVSGNEGTNAGEYTLTVTAKDTTNYTGSAKAKFTIARKPVSVATAVATNRPYNESRDVSVAVTFDDSDVPAQTVTGKMADADAGTDKPVTITVTLSDTNYTLSAQPTGVTVTISQAAALTLADINLSHRYSAEGTERRDLSGLVAGAKSYTLSPVEGNTGIIKDLAVSPAGMLTYTKVPQGSFVPGTKATVTVTIVSKNYENSTVTVIISLTDKLTQAPLTITTTGPATYGQNLNLSASGGSGTGAVTFSVANVTGSATIAGNVLTPTQAGTVTVTATRAADEDYEEAHSDPVTITINKGTPVVRPTYTAINSNGKTLADANLGLPIGMTPAGTIAWDMAPATSVTANTRYNWTFTPDDTVNWNTVTGNIVLWNYRPSRPGGSGSTGTGTGSGGNTGSVPSRPSSSSGGSTTASAGGSSVSSGVSSTTARPSVTVINGTASAAVTSSMGQRLVEEAVRNSSSTVTVSPRMDRGTTSAAISIPSDTVRDLSSGTKADLRINSPVADVTIPNGALAGLASGGDITVSTALRDGVVSVDIASNGSSVKQVSGGVTVQIPASYCTYSTVAMLVNADGSTQVIRKSVPDPTQGVVSVPLDGSAQVTVSGSSQSFGDVSGSSWAANAVAFISSHEIMNGTSEGAFSPDAPMTRSMLAAVLHNIEGNPKSSGLAGFSDVGSSWYTDAVQWAAGQGIVSGYSDGRFAPDDMVTREQLAVMLYRYAGQPAASVGALSFADAGQMSTWAEDAIRWAVGAGILSGDGSRLNPGGQATRAEAASMLMRFMIIMSK